MPPTERHKGKGAGIAKKLRVRTLFFLLLVGGVAYYFALPDPLFKTPYSSVLMDRNEGLLGARIAEDGQWRFPERDSVPERFRKALLRFEDQRFHYHPGVDPMAVIRAAYQNVKEGRIVSGASTISMQVIRLSRDEERTFFEKAIEAVLATRLELRESKEGILGLYASHAPFGGNVVGLDAAAWRYFGKRPDELGWGEAATLAVLPNDPASIHPGRGRDELERKRDRLLGLLRDEGTIDSTTCRLARMEELPRAPEPLPDDAPHFLTRIQEEKPEERFHSTIDRSMQKRVTRIVEGNVDELERNEVHNAAAMVMEVNSGKVRAYVGNAEPDSGKHGRRVDMISARRSSGSILKPFLYSSMLEEGELLPEQFLPDIPLRIDGFSPENYDHAFRGAIPADRALARSLNVPAVHLLREYGVGRFLDRLRELGFSTMERNASHYGLSLILGGCETRLEELVSVYGDMARSLYRFNRGRGTYDKPFHRDPVYAHGEGYGPGESSSSYHPPLRAGSIWASFEAMEKVHRPEEERGWGHFRNSEAIAYKTGTSYGHRDAWAIGVTPQYVVGVWAGNADGEGRSGLSGVSSAAPTLFEIFRSLEVEGSFKPPDRALKEAAVCARSGHFPSRNCPKLDSVLLPKAPGRTHSCPYHRQVLLSEDRNFRVSAACLPASERIAEERFVLPPSWEHFYRTQNPSYRPLPPFAPYCHGKSSRSGEMALIQPSTAQSTHYIPIRLSGKKGKLVFEASHRQDEEELHWHLDDRYLGSTEGIHEMAFKVEKGEHTMRIIDEDGSEIVHPFEVMEKEKG